jgi:hypothetical protein
MAGDPVEIGENRVSQEMAELQNLFGANLSSSSSGTTLRRACLPFHHGAALRSGRFMGSHLSYNSPESSIPLARLLGEHTLLNRILY